MGFASKLQGRILPQSHPSRVGVWDTPREGQAWDRRGDSSDRVAINGAKETPHLPSALILVPSPAPLTSSYYVLLGLNIMSHLWDFFFFLQFLYRLLH